jgi:hypothetical protein
LPKQFGIHHSLALTPIGAIGYRSHWPIIDLVGLIDKHIAHMSVPLGKGMAGHEKFDANYVLSKNPDFILLHTWLWSKIPPKEALEPSLGMQAEQNMYRNPVFIRNYRPIIIPIFGRYLIIFERKNLLLNSRPG